MKLFDDLVRTDTSSNYCLFAYNTPNLGDYIQVLAILQHVTPARFVLRDKIAPQPDLTLVANGWLTHGKLPSNSEFRSLIFAGVHLHPPLRRPEALDSFLNAGTVGCRDIETYRFFRRHNVPAVLCRCPTLTFPAYYGPRYGVFCVDVGEKTVRRAASRLRSYGDLVCMTHLVNWLPETCLSDDSFRKRLREAYDALLVYRSARLVITTRLHVALPCLAFGTPVIFMGPKDSRWGAFHNFALDTDISRFRWLKTLLPMSTKLPPVIECEPEKEMFSFFLQTQLASVRSHGSQRVRGELMGVESGPGIKGNPDVRLSNGLSHSELV